MDRQIKREWGTGTKGGCVPDKKNSKPSKDLFTHCLMVTIIPLWLSDNTLHLISGHPTSPVIPDSWEAEKAKVQFNRFTARQNWVACGCLTKSFLSQSLYISGFTPMSIEKVSLDLSQSRLSLPLPDRSVKEVSLSITSYYGWRAVWSAPSWNETKCSDKTHTCRSPHRWKC